MWARPERGRGENFARRTEEDGTITFTIDEPGSYFFVCHNVGGTWPAIQQDEGVWGTLIV